MGTKFLQQVLLHPFQRLSLENHSFLAGFSFTNILSNKTVA